MKYIVRISLLLLFLVPIAQAQQCSHGDSNGYSKNSYNPACSSGGTYGNYSVQTTDFFCVNDNDGSTYATHNSTVTGYGQIHFWPYCSGVPYECDEVTSIDWTDATSPTDYNRFYNRAFDVYYSANTCPQNGIWRQDFWQCKGIACKNCGTCYVHVCCSSPVLIDVGGQGFALTDAANGVMFDISATGTPVQTSWTAPGANNAFLALPGADGLIHNGSQLFGNFTSQPPSSTKNGFAALAVYDDPKNGGNGDGVIDAKDVVFGSLRLWIDANHDGISQPEELHTLPSLGVNSISLTYKLDQRTDQWGNKFQYRAQVNPGDPAGVGRQAYDVFFIGLPGTAKNMLNRAGGKCQVPTNKVGMLAPVVSSLR